MANNKYELGKAYVQVVPTTEGISGKLSSAFSSEGSVAGEVFGATFGANMLTGVVAKAASAAMQVGEVLVNTVKEAVNNYGDYEQLTGGVEKLFGNSADTVMQYAEEAYKTAGISANEYMEQITSFAASLVNSLDGDTKEAAVMGNQAVVDMADNANTFGTAIESIQNAYQGFAKQNYTMLDNLKLGYGGTKEEMERLITDAEKLDSSFKATRDENDNLTMSFSEIVQAIHIVQTEMNVTGTTSKEAASTLQGSAGTAQAAWQNLLTTLGDENGDVEEAVEDWTDAVKTNIENTAKVVRNVFQNIPEFVSGVCSAAYDVLTDHYINLGDVIVGTGELLQANEDYYQSQIDFMNDSLIPLEENQSLLNQLKDLINENGEVAEDKLSLAQYLVDELNGTYGTSLELQGNRIEGYDTEIEKIQEIIDKEKSRLMTEQVQSNTETAMANLTTDYEAYIKALEEAEAAEASYRASQENQEGGMVAGWKLEWEEKQAALEEATEAYTTAQAIATQAQENEIALKQGNLDQIILIDQEMIDQLGNTKDAIAAIYDQKIEETQLKITTLQEIQKTANDETKAAIDAEISILNSNITKWQDQKNAKIQAAQEAKDGVASAYAETEQVETDSSEKRKSIVQNANKEMAEDTKATYSSVYNSALTNSSRIKSIASSTSSSSVKAFTNKENDYFQSGVNSLAGFEQGVINRLPISLTVVSSAASKIHGALKSYNGEQSPAKLYRKSGKFAMEGYALGIEDNTKLAEDAMEGMAEGVAGKASLLSDIPIGVNTEGIEGVSVLDAFMPEAAAETKAQAAEASAGTSEMIVEVFDAIKETLEDIKAYLPTLAEAANKNIVLDSGELVGSITPKINDKMGEMRVAGNRGITCMA